MRYADMADKLHIGLEADVATSCDVLSLRGPTPTELCRRVWVHSCTFSDKVVPMCDGGPFGKDFPL